jgi:indole-3-glycerol phosphate synthase
MADILEEIVAYKRNEVEKFRSELSQVFLEGRSEIVLRSKKVTEPMSKALRNAKGGIIAEFKRKSPSKGWINRTASPDIIPLSYQANGAAALSILTDTKYFGGSNQHILAAVNHGVKLPVLYKNFIISEYQIYQACLSRASAVLLIAACLTRQECASFISKAHSLGMEVLLELHSDQDLDYVDLGADMYGINNRNLGTFTVDVENSFRLVGSLPPDSVKVSESGISDPSVAKDLISAGFDGLLIGESFMREEDPGLALNQFISAL